MQVCDAMCFRSPRCESRGVRALDETSDLCSAMCIAETTFSMRCICAAIRTLAAVFHCDVGLDGSIAVRAMLLCGELRLPSKNLGKSRGPPLSLCLCLSFSQDPIRLPIFDLILGQRAWKGILMPRDTNCRKTVFAAQLPRTYPHRGGNSERGKKALSCGEEAFWEAF